MIPLILKHIYSRVSHSGHLDWKWWIKISKVAALSVINFTGNFRNDTTSSYAVIYQHLCKIESIHCYQNYDLGKKNWNVVWFPFMLTCDLFNCDSINEVLKIFLLDTRIKETLAKWN